MTITIVKQSTYRWTALTPGAWFASDSLTKTVQRISVCNNVTVNGGEKQGLM